MQTQALIFDIQDLSVQDGPGIRTTVFMKGCPLKCRWCSNPEGQLPYPELMHLNVLCNRTHNCILACPNKAVKSDDEYGAPVFDRSICRNCETLDCIESCPTFALKVSGKYITLEELIKKVKPNMPYYKNSGGGVTFSGGEPFLQAEFIRKFMDETSRFGLSVGVETCGMFDMDDVSGITEKLDFIYFDLKCMDDEIHREVTGSSNKIILSNLKHLAEKFSSKIIISVPVVPGVNDFAEQIKPIAEYCRKLGIYKIRLLPYHSMGEGKYYDLGREYKMDKNLSVPVKQLAVFKNLIESSGITCWLE